jgi:hypothetical protein
MSACRLCLVVGIALGFLSGIAIGAFALPVETCVTPDMRAVKQENDMLWSFVQFGLPCKEINDAKHK